MSPSDAPAVPDRLEALCGFALRCACGRTHAVPIREIALGKGVLDEVVRLARGFSPAGPVAVVFDRKTREVGGERTAALLEGAGFAVRRVPVPDGAGGRPHADEATLRLVEGALAGQALAVAVGAGTINDLCKLSSHRAGIPYLCVPTAPSMNGYTSSLAAVMLGGVKRTVDCPPPAAVVADLDILARAPLELIRAGLGDLESKPTSTADFRLGGWLGRAAYCRVPEGVVLSAEARAAEVAEGIGRADPAALAVLAEALLLSGISMTLAGSSAPASGGEHLISHHWDMTAGAEGRVEGLHGAQVGVCTLISASLYQELAALDPGAIDVERRLAARPDRGGLERRCRAAHPEQPDEVWAEWQKKLLSSDALRAELSRVREGWKDLWQELGEVLRPAQRIREILLAAGAPVTVRSLGLTPEHARRSLRSAHQIRGRFTVLDLADELGVLDELADRVLERAGVNS
ncbi:MAG: sn-glycerol-1-phosphate dehydrogenase [Myxococcales bacterium]|nr:sn-glycerol-1-phosphate dehydrogenase [Myxococcales bacterium]